MKCRYNYCRNGNEVKKEDAVKVGKAYYCKDCYKEKELKVNISSMIHEMLPNEVKMNINKCICDWIHKKNFEIEYVVYTLEYIIKNECKLNSVYGVIYYLNNKDIKEEFDNKKSFDKFREVTKGCFDIDDTDFQFTYKSNTGEGWCKIL